MRYAEPSSQREITDAREHNRTSRRRAGAWGQAEHAAFIKDRQLRNAALRVAGAITLGEADEASERVAAHTSLRQSTTEGDGAFVRRITLAMLSEMVEQ